MVITDFGPTGKSAWPCCDWRWVRISVLLRGVRCGWVLICFDVFADEIKTSDRSLVQDGSVVACTPTKALCTWGVIGTRSRCLGVYSVLLGKEMVCVCSWREYAV